MGEGFVFLQVQLVVYGTANLMSTTIDQKELVSAVHYNLGLSKLT